MSRLLSLTLLLLFPVLAPAAAPNLVFIIADDCTYLDMEVSKPEGPAPTLRQMRRSLEPGQESQLIDE